MFHNAACPSYALTVRDNQDVVVGDYYMEQSTHYLLCEGGKRPGQGARHYRRLEDQLEGCGGGHAAQLRGPGMDRRRGRPVGKRPDAAAPPQAGGRAAGVALFAPEMPGASRSRSWISAPQAASCGWAMSPRESTAGRSPTRCPTPPCRKRRAALDDFRELGTVYLRELVRERLPCFSSQYKITHISPQRVAELETPPFCMIQSTTCPLKGRPK